MSEKMFTLYRLVWKSTAVVYSPAWIEEGFPKFHKVQVQDSMSACVAAFTERDEIRDISEKEYKEYRF